MLVKKYLPTTVKHSISFVKDILFGETPSFGSDTKPKMLSIEPTSRCNLNCPFCLVGQQNSLESTEHDLLPRGMGDMEWPLYEKIIKDAVDFGIERVQLHFQGEPLLHKRFPDMIREVKKYGLKTQVFTNGLPLTEKKADEIISAGLDSIRFSVDGASQATYSLNRVGGEFEKVYKNMDMMVKRAKKKKSNIDLTWQFIALRNNEHEVDEAKNLAKAINIPFFVKTFAETDPNLAPRNPKLRRKLQLKPCTDIYRMTLVYYTGEVVICCYDLKGQHIVGDLREQSLKEIWNSNKYRTIRKRIDSADQNPKEEPEICKNCLKWSHKDYLPQSNSIVNPEEQLTSTLNNLGDLV